MSHNSGEMCSVKEKRKERPSFFIDFSVYIHDDDDDVRPPSSEMTMTSLVWGWVRR